MDRTERPILPVDIIPYIPIAGGVAPAVLLCWFEQAYHANPTPNAILRGSLAHWRLDGAMRPKAFNHAFHFFGYHYQSLLEFNLARSAGREFIHPGTGKFLIYILIIDLRNDDEFLIRNTPLIEARLAGLTQPPVTETHPPVTSSVPVLPSIRAAGKQEARDFMGKIGMKPGKTRR